MIRLCLSLPPSPSLSLSFSCLAETDRAVEPEVVKKVKTKTNSMKKVKPPSNVPTTPAVPATGGVRVTHHSHGKQPGQVRPLTDVGGIYCHINCV